MQGLGGTGSQQAKECAFDAGYVAGAPLKISWFLVIFFVYQLIDAVHAQGIPVWVRVITVCGNEFLLLLTVLCHEMGHGTMARRCGGDISQVLLWPFGGICFTTRAQSRAPKQKLVDDLWIVGAGPATHFPQVAVWFALLSIVVAWSQVLAAPAWHHLVPFSSAMPPCVDLNGKNPHCFHSFAGLLLYQFLVQGIQLNVMLFLFNVFFPMYPMDGAKLIVCGLQLFCGASALCAANVLIYTSIPLSVLFIGHALTGLGGGGMQPGITMFMGFMCLSEAYKIYKLKKEQRLYTHPLFELARSDTARDSDGMGMSMRLNNSDRDDEEARAAQVSYAEVKPFEGSGRALGQSGGAALGSAGAPATAQAASGQGRAAFLQRMDEAAAQRTKTVRELEEERLERERLNGRATGFRA